MRTTSRIGSLALLTVVTGLAVSASGCFVDNSSGPASVCYPDLYVNWQVVDNTDTPLTCASVGATSVTGQVGGFTDTEPCPAAASSGPQLVFLLNQVGTYSVNVQLRDANGAILSETGVNMAAPSIYVDCSGNTQSQPLLLSIN